MYRIKAILSFGDVKEGDIGGLVDSESNLSQNGNCWIYDNSMAWNNARISGNAKVMGNAHIEDEAQVYGNAIICDSQVLNKAQVYGNALISGRAQIYGSAQVYDDVQIDGHIYVGKKAKVCGKLRIFYTYMHILGKCTIPPIFITHDRRNVTITNSDIYIEDYSRLEKDKLGNNKKARLPFMFHPISKWLQYDEEQLKEMGIWDWWKQWSSVIFEAVRTQRKND
jgi:cytoskeletal protein CcmA (bactofilin family)